VLVGQIVVGRGRLAWMVGMIVARNVATAIESPLSSENTWRTTPTSISWLLSRDPLFSLTGQSKTLKRLDCAIISTFISRSALFSTKTSTVASNPTRIK
jgi:hypothetical protein